MPRGPRKPPPSAPEPADASIYATEDDRRFLAEYEAFYTALRENDPAAWEEFLEEHREWDFTLMDGLEDE
jgi:DNA-binding GntR family transcriptional regulator